MSMLMWGRCSSNSLRRLSNSFSRADFALLSDSTPCAALLAGEGPRPGPNNKIPSVTQKAIDTRTRTTTNTRQPPARASRLSIAQVPSTPDRKKSAFGFSEGGALHRAKPTDSFLDWRMCGKERKHGPARKWIDDEQMRGRGCPVVGKTFRTALELG